jgi:hypothetical protein
VRFRGIAFAHDFDRHAELHYRPFGRGLIALPLVQEREDTTLVACTRCKAERRVLPRGRVEAFAEGDDGLVQPIGARLANSESTWVSTLHESLTADPVSISNAFSMTNYTGSSAPRWATSRFVMSIGGVAIGVSVINRFSATISSA